MEGGEEVVVPGESLAGVGGGGVQYEQLHVHGLTSRTSASVSGLLHRRCQIRAVCCIERGSDGDFIGAQGVAIGLEQHFRSEEWAIISKDVRHT